MGVEIRTTEQKQAKKDYRCQLCGKVIFAGNQYIYEKYKDPEGFHALRRHIHCDAMLDAYNQKYNWDECYDETEVTETLWEEICKNVCDEDQLDKCNMSDLYGCEICQKEILSGPILGEAIQSARDNYEWTND